MAGMRPVPKDVHRERADDKRPATWYVVWLGEPHARGSVIIGRSKRLERPRWHRFFPQRRGTECRDIEGWVNGAEWLLQVHAGPITGA